MMLAHSLKKENKELVPKFYFFQTELSHLSETYLNFQKHIKSTISVKAINLLTLLNQTIMTLKDSTHIDLKHSD